MRLLNTSTLHLESFVQRIPAYAILSHTWGDGEVTFDDISEPHAIYMTGYQKILRCCQQARKDGFKYCWVDTCCIDKRSSAELSEAINSVYRFYQEADICYAYLADVSSANDPFIPSSVYSTNSAFQQSRWFGRGWTLQELIAPRYVEFYNSDWELIGTKHGLIEQIKEATNIDADVLTNPIAIANYSIAQKFSWLALRETTRDEDMAYCMLGFFDLHMPLIYGEGKRAFVRLQEEIVKRSTDQTFLCWESEPDGDFVFEGPFCENPRVFWKSGSIQRDISATSARKTQVLR